MPEPRPSALRRLVTSFEGALEALNAKPTPEQLERWSVIVHECMSARGRSFHNVEHVFDIAAGGDPAEVLAALYHDTVYYQVDGGLPAKLSTLLADTIEVSEGTVKLAPFDPTADPARALVAAIFGFSPGQVLSPFAGLNEVLSTLLVARTVGPAIPTRTLALVACCIEATIPFRKPAADGRTAADALAARLSEVDGRFGLKLSAADRLQAVQRAVRLANRDVANFAFEDTARFLDNTWKLLPETNQALRSESAYTVREYRGALQKMEGFLSNLDPKVIFAGFQGAPPPAEVEELTRRAARNLRLGSRYLRAKLLAAHVLEALAEASGGDAPIALFMGDLPDPHGGVRVERLEERLPPDPSPPAADVDEEVWRLLAHGRSTKSGFDIQHSPLAAMLYRAQGDVSTDAMLAAARGGAAPRDLLARVSKPVLGAVVKAVVALAPTRRLKLEALLKG